MDAVGLGPAELGRLAGTTRQQVHKLAQGERQLTKAWAERLAPHLGTTWDGLMGTASPGMREAAAPLIPQMIGKTEDQADEEFADISAAVLDMLRDAGMPTDARSVAILARHVERKIAELGEALPFPERLEFTISEERSRLQREW